MRIHMILGASLMVLLAGAWPAAADMEQPGAAAPEENAHAKIEEIDKRIAALEQEKQELAKKSEAAEQLRQRREELAEIVRAGRERLQEIENELTENAAVDIGDSPARKARQQARGKWLKDMRATIEPAVAIQDPARLGKAREIREHAEDLQNEWELTGARTSTGSGRADRGTGTARRQGGHPDAEGPARTHQDPGRG